MSSGNEKAASIEQTVRRQLVGLIATVIATILTVGIVISNYAISTQQRLQTQAFDSIGFTWAAALAQQTQVYVEYEDKTLAKAELAKTHSRISDCRYVAVVSSDGAVFAASPANYRPPNGAALLSESTSATNLDLAGTPTRHFVMTLDVDGQRADSEQDTRDSYFVHLGLDRTPSLLTQEALRKNAVLLTLLILSIGTFVVLALVRNVDRQVGRTAAKIREELHAKLAGTAQELKRTAAETLAIGRQTEVTASDEAAAVVETRRTMQSLLEAAAEIAEGAESVLDIARRSMEASSVISQRISKLDAQAAKIADVSETIRGIAEKSDILALNASLEGAKAGETGRGFVLVGEEMRRLAETVMDAVRQIKGLAGEIRQLSHSAVIASEEGQKLAAHTTETAHRITLITGQQRSGTEQVATSMDEVQRFSQQAEAASKQARTMASELTAMAKTLTTLLEERSHAH